jgi:hypothetical protein
MRTVSTTALVADGLLVADDVHAIVERAAEQWAWLHASSPRTASVRVADSP